MVGWLKLLLAAAAVMVGLWALLVILAARLPPGLLKDLTGFLPACVTLARRLRADPRVPFKAKAAVVLAGLWVLSPVDLLPEFLPVIGPLDDVVVVALAFGMRPGGCRGRCCWRPGRATGGCWNGCWGRYSIRPSRSHETMSQTRPEDHRTRFRRPLGVAVMAYKAVLGLSEIAVGVLLAVPSFDPQATFARLSAEELREDPGDRLVALISRHLPALLHHRGTVAVGLIVFGLAKLVAAAAMWEGQEWGGYLLAATVAILLPFDLRQAMVDPTVGHILLAMANTAALAVLVMLLRGWLPGRSLIARPNRR
jgi:uncharacterized membrane protein